MIFLGPMSKGIELKSIILINSDYYPIKYALIIYQLIQ